MKAAYTLFALFVLGAVATVLAIIGWIMNVFTIFTLWAGDVTAELIIRLVGVPVPFIGAIAGWF